VHKVVASDILGELATKPDNIACRGDQFEPQDVARGDAILDGFAASCILCNIAAERTGFEAHRIACIKKSLFLHKVIDFVGYDTGLNRHGEVS